MSVMDLFRTFTDAPLVPVTTVDTIKAETVRVTAQLQRLTGELFTIEHDVSVLDERKGGLAFRAEAESDQLATAALEQLLLERDRLMLTAARKRNAIAVATRRLADLAEQQQAAEKERDLAETRAAACDLTKAGATAHFAFLAAREALQVFIDADLRASALASRSREHLGRQLGDRLIDCLSFYFSWPCERVCGTSFELNLTAAHRKNDFNGASERPFTPKETAK